MISPQGKQHERIVQNLVRNCLKAGCPPEAIRISAQQNPGLEKWAQRKGIIFDPEQKFDILHPEEFEVSGTNKAR